MKNAITNDFIIRLTISTMLALSGIVIILFIFYSYTSYIVAAKIIKRELLVDREELPEGDYKVNDVKRNIYYEFRDKNGMLQKGKKHVTYWAWEKYRKLDVIEITYLPAELDSAPSILAQILYFILGVVLIAGSIFTWSGRKPN